MSFLRVIGLCIVALWLAACDKPDSPEPPAELSQTEPARAEEIEASPAVTPEDKSEAAEAPLAGDAPAKTPAVSQRTSKASSSAPVEIERTPLELNLNISVFDPLQPYTLDEMQPEALLPPLFEEKPAEESSFQLNGKLITNDRVQGDYWDSVEGAQLEFEFKQ